MSTVSIIGTIATEPRHLVTDQGLSITSFRLAATERRYDADSGSWVDGHTSWFTVSAFRRLAHNAAASLHKGEGVIVKGRLRLREWGAEGRTGITAEIDADSIGHDLRWGTTAYTAARTQNNGRPGSDKGGKSSPEKSNPESSDLNKTGDKAADSIWVAPTWKSAADSSETQEPEAQLRMTA